MTQSPKRAAKPSVPVGIDTELVTALAKLLQDTDLSEIEVQKGDFRVRVVRMGAAPGMTHVAVVPVVPGPAPRTSAVATVASTDPDVVNPNNVPSPMVGTAYRRASPGSKAFVEIGSHVALGEKILLIEAMKTFNDIVAPRAGIVTAILIEDGQPVEYGQPLMVIE